MSVITTLSEEVIAKATGQHMAFVGKTGSGKTYAAKLFVAGVLGLTTSSSPVATAKRGVLNPALARWLMGYPVAWCDCVVTAMQSFPRSRLRS